VTEEILFSTLTDVALREAWAHEAHSFTPWLAANLDRLSGAIGVPLELTGTEMRVGAFSADILARNATDDSVVLIENQLEGSDHTHLGQIMTYLAGLEAHTMVWVAPSFRDEHLSAIRWLNEHTVDPFAFFAVRVRVVRIADSPFAPLFEVIERPNNWDRTVAIARRESEGGLTEIGQFRRDFWTHYANMFPGGQKPGGTSSQWVALPGTEAQLAQYVSQGAVGVFVRPGWGGSVEETQAELAPMSDAIAAELGTSIGSGRTMFESHRSANMRDQSNWNVQCRWLHDAKTRYQRALAACLGAQD
jgi:hypothetical protein